MLRSNRQRGGSGYFFLLSTAWRTREIIATIRIQKAIKSCHVTIFAPPLFQLGAKKHHPRKKSGGTAYRGTGSTIDSITRNSTNCKQKQGMTHKYLGPCLFSVKEALRLKQYHACRGGYQPPATWQLQPVWLNGTTPIMSFRPERKRSGGIHSSCKNNLRKVKLAT